MVVLDSTVLMYLISPGLPPPVDSNTGRVVSHPRERVDNLLAFLQKAKRKIIIPAPTLGEVFVYADTAASEYLKRWSKSAAFKIAPYDLRAALEASTIMREAKQSGSKKGGSESPWQKIKCDYQIVAIACVEGASRIYSDDPDIARFAAWRKIPVTKLVELPLPDMQQGFEFGTSQENKHGSKESVPDRPGAGGQDSRTDGTGSAAVVQHAAQAPEAKGQDVEGAPGQSPA